LPSTHADPRPRRLVPLARTLTAVVLLAALGAVAGCGSSSAPGSAVDPASVVPADAALYAAATVRPSGAQKTAALEAGKALSHRADPYARLLAALQTPGSPPLDFAKDVAPWLGPRAGIYLASLDASSALTSELEQGLLGSSGANAAFPFASGAQGALVLDTSDSAKASSFLDEQAKHAGAHGTSYRGVSYQVTSAGLAFALVQRLAVIGSESGVRSVIDTSLGGASLAHASEYSTLLAKAPSEALAHVYSSAAAAKAAAAGKGLSGPLALLTGGRTANISLVAAASSLALDADTLSASGPATGTGLLSADPQAAQALGELPGDSWLAIGLGHLGTSLSTDVKDLQGLTSLSGAGSASTGASSSGFGLSALLGALTTPLSKLGASSPQAKRDYASWMGQAGIFASGAGLLELQAAVVIASTNATRSRAAVAELGNELSESGVAVQKAKIPGTEAAIAVRLSGLPLVLDIAAARDANGQPKFVLALGEASLAGALDPSSTLAGSTTATSAAASLGEGTKPSVIVDFPTLLGLFESVGLLEEPAIAKFVPYLRSATTLVGGGHPLDAEVDRFRVVLGLTPAAG
jgi:Protein of unknown function (DUF3352)